MRIKKKVISIRNVAIILTVMVGVLSTSIPVQAASTSVRNLNIGWDYSVNLNGDRKKDIISTNINENYLQIEINGESACFQPLDEQYMDVSLYLLDINTKDKYQELLVEIIDKDGSSTLDDFFVIRYYKKGKIKKYKYSLKDSKVKLYRLGLEEKSDIIAKNTGKNAFYVYADTPVYTTTFGNYFAKIPVKLSNGKLKVKSSSTYRLSSYICNGGYTLRKKMKLYKTSSRKKVKKILGAGTSFKPIKIKPVNLNAIGRCNLYVYVKSSAGTKGWLYFPDKGEPADYLIQPPLWG